MFSSQPSWQERFFRFSSIFFRASQATQLPSIDFARPWWWGLWQRKFLLIPQLVFETSLDIVRTLTPVILGWIVVTQKLEYFIYWVIFYLFLCLGSFTAWRWSLLAYGKAIFGLYYQAHNFFLQVDPLYHTTRSSGQIFAKIDRGAYAYDEILDDFLFQLLPTVVSVITVIATLFVFDFTIGSAALIILAIIAVINIVTKLLISKPFQQKLIAAEDSLKAAAVENLQEVFLVRASFATNEQDTKTRRRGEYMLRTWASVWYGHSFLDMGIKMLYLLGLILVGWLVFAQLQAGQLTTAIAVSLLVTYFAGSYEVLFIGGKVRRFIEKCTNVADLFQFIRDFGKQTYPVLNSNVHSQDDVEEGKRQANIVLEARDLHFTYTEQTQVFENHSLRLEVNSKQANKLYGIIGPSGLGKTTLLSILGGQLKPVQGEISLNGLNIYDLSDTQRRQLLGLQTQSSSNLRGTLRYNLLFALPGNHEEVSVESSIYSDSQLIEVLQKVGLWNLFLQKDGLDTLIGEGGLNLSGGQRQRLNFAGLYLRAKYYHPLVILVDEPTSSLDELSEKAITEMIQDLARDSLTLVIAHRLKTLENSVALLDFSLIKESKDLEFLPANQLLQKSDYYRQLIEGEAELDV